MTKNHNNKRLVHYMFYRLRIGLVKSINTYLRLNIVLCVGVILALNVY